MANKTIIIMKEKKKKIFFIPKIHSLTDIKK